MVTEGVDSGQHESSLSVPSCAEMLGLALRVCRFLRVRPRGKGQRRLIVEAAVYVASRFQLEAHRLCVCESQPCCGCPPPTTACSEGTKRWNSGSVQLSV